MDPFGVNENRLMEDEIDEMVDRLEFEWGVEITEYEVVDNSQNKSSDKPTCVKDQESSQSTGFHADRTTISSPSKMEDQE